MTKDNFQEIRVGKIQKSTMTKKSDKKSARLAALEIQFGFNRKKDNFSKTNQLSLF